jgi:hypothetical protein
VFTASEKHTHTHTHKHTKRHKKTQKDTKRHNNKKNTHLVHEAGASVHHLCQRGGDADNATVARMHAKKGKKGRHKELVRECLVANATASND